ncbi:hypothetical protein SAMN05443507_13616 [Alicyclobacillus tolerans]|uniref:Uncharacterized protein n=1 Tax=Alicyclobacillus tolerans TaxID=90970 RepID=A0A1M6XR44_9BACL|nr:hypothetical protein SAMN05443507_13616 [Alicyclobacillus montanus]
MLRIIIVSIAGLLFAYPVMVLGTWILVRFWDRPKKETKRSLWISIIVAWTIVVTKIAGIW